MGDWDDLAAWLDEHRPDDSGQCLIHNDWRFDNLVLDPADGLRVTGVLDWEMATVGDPLMDLAGALAYWIQADDDAFFRQFRRQPTTAPGMWTRDRVVDWYCDRRGFAMEPDRWRFYEAFGLFRLAVILQQIWYRFVHGQTSNPAYAGFGEAVRYLEHRTRRIVHA
jgi:aminoglycoside phosphotransferase (APT) family kinase protein